MRICYVNPTIPLRRPIAELSKLMRNDGHEVSIIWPRRLCRNVDKEWHSSKGLDGIKIIDIPSFYIPSVRYPIPVPFMCFFKTLNAMKKNDIMHIWVYWYVYSLMPLLLKRLLGFKTKIILSVDGFVGYSYKWPNKILNSLFYIQNFFMNRLIFRTPDLITLYSKRLVKYAKRLKLPMDKVKVVPTGIHLDRFDIHVSGVRKELGINDKEVVITSVAMMTERKGIDVVIKSCKRLLDEGFEVKVILVGGGTSIEEYKNLAKGYPKIMFLGSRSDVPEILVASDIFVLPSEGEGLPGAVMEAMAVGLPVVVGDDGLTPDLVVDGDNGFLVKPRDIGGCYLRLKSLVEDGKLRFRMGKKSISKIKEFSWNVVLPKYRSIYGE